MANPPKQRRKRKRARHDQTSQVPRAAAPAERPSRPRIRTWALLIAAAVLLLAVGGTWLVQSRTGPAVPPPLPDLTGVEAPVAAKIRRLREAVSQHPRSAEDWGRLALTLHAHGFLAEAVSAYARATERDPGKLAWLYLGGLALFHQESDSAIEWFERAYALRPDYTPLLLNYARALLAAGRLDEATVMFQRVLVREPASPHAHLGLARLAVLQEDLGDARLHLEQALLTAPFDPEVHALLADVLSRQGETESAALELERSKQGKSFAPFPDPLYRQMMAEGVGSFWHLSRGETDMHWGQYAAAAAEFEEAVRLSPDATSYTRLGSALDRLGKTDSAVRVMETAVALAPANVEALLNFSAVLLSAGRMDEAIARAEEARHADSAAPEPYLLLNQLYGRSGRWRDAVAVLREGNAAVPDHAQLMTALAWLLATSPEPAVRNGTEAVRLARTATELTSHRTVEPLDALAAAYAESGQYDLAIATAQEAREIALAARRPELASQISGRINAYRAGRPWRVGGNPTRQP